MDLVEADVGVELEHDERDRADEPVATVRARTPPAAQRACRRGRVGSCRAGGEEDDEADHQGERDAGYARRVRSQTRLTQAEFAARIGVPIETVRNWEQGKRQPRGPARALLKLLDQAPDVAFSVLGRKSS